MRAAQRQNATTDTGTPESRLAARRDLLSHSASRGVSSAELMQQVAELPEAVASINPYCMLVDYLAAVFPPAESKGFHL